MNAKRLLVVLIALSLMLSASCFAALWMDAVGRVSGWTGLPQYESKIPELRWYGTLWESLAVGFIFIAAFVLGLGKRVTTNDVSPTWFAVLFGFLPSRNFNHWYCGIRIVVGHHPETHPQPASL